MGVWGSGGSGFQGYDYVQTDQPANPEEGQTWYDVDGDAAFVYDGAAWLEMTVTDHGQLSGVTAGAHRSDANIRTTVDGQVDADTVDGKHASDLGGTLGNYYFTGSVSFNESGGSASNTWQISGSVVPVFARVSKSGGDGGRTAELRYADGSSIDMADGDNPVLVATDSYLDEIYLACGVWDSSQTDSASVSMELVGVQM
ncbi:hypothetical protein [Halobacterium wangiae]|uniref:hypothetical protein n=1 Tax=Halobacterium wangiae TaxID=2902623 RepID=UPI001E44490A|nr:hypothetical protein [Halobacterium wangiae]